MNKIRTYSGVALAMAAFAILLGPAALAQEKRPGDAKLAELLKKIDAMPAPKGIPVNKTLDKHFKKRMAAFTDQQRRRFNTLRQGMDLFEPDMENRGLSYLKILEYIHHNEK